MGKGSLSLREFLPNLRDSLYSRLMFINGPSFLKWANPRLFFIYFRSFQANNTYNRILQQINEKYVHPVYSARIRTHDLWNISRLPITTRQGLSPFLMDYLAYGYLLVGFEPTISQSQSAPITTGPMATLSFPL